MAHVIERVEVFCYRVPVKVPVATSFGVMRDRPAVFVKLTDQDGCFGWGEIFANWPAAAAEHRAQLLVRDICDLVVGAIVAQAGDLFERLTTQTHIRALQSGEWGPFAQVIAGLDIALHDMFSRREGVSVARFLNADAASTVPTYASGIAIGAAPELIARARAAGHDAFKVKIGFGADDMDQLRDLSGSLQGGEALMADVNQAWSVADALALAGRIDAVGLGWLEEPIRADLPAEGWAALADTFNTPLAGGENITGHADFDAAIATRHLSVIQPDIVKWGGLGGCAAVARKVRDAGLRYCPHFLGGGIGLIASGHLLAAVGGDGLLEVDVNPNPLRDAFGGALVEGGMFDIAHAPGLGVENLPEELAQFQTLALEAHA
ncbi:L-alanine-DL-glutamate epimerase-like enolase superfamily enzyme [Litoreibacter halocynthiae]|uniref:L-alanine-DL-glutamate epimerase-like enolase superfamily enzyme n=1 Tax=Litoreibacter halocynthiae TaxID=1242689 RepID=A0A4R7LM23_9RHOB|nr:mandelate racemase/muconate lactonizing enzyme family protein [Litoreibacter halocynthiae]TDT77033.1 L-alanine-DL-glutamate epimerase-like enolase superfamily enzyme [Litoreibacter halocynthiae]